MKSYTAIVICFFASISAVVGRLGTFNRSLAGENRTLFEDYGHFNRSLEFDFMFNRSLFNRSLESRRLMEESYGLYNRTLANRTLMENRNLDEYEELFGGYNRSLEFFNRTLSNRTL